MANLNKKKTKAKKIPVKKLSRKELRKQKEVDKKEQKRIFFSSKTEGKKLVAEAKLQKINQNVKTKKNKKKKSQVNINPDDIPIEQLLSGEVGSDDDESLDSDFSDDEVDSLLPETLKAKKPKLDKPIQTKKSKQMQPIRPSAEEVHRKELQRQKEITNASKKRRIKQLKLENEEEDVMIARLEKKLGINKTKNKNRLVRKMFNDGLDFALELCLDDEDEKEKQALKDKRKEELKKNQSKEPSWSDEEQDEEKFNAIFGSGEESDGALVNDLEGDDESDLDGDCKVTSETDVDNSEQSGEEKNSIKHDMTQSECKLDEV